MRRMKVRRHTITRRGSAPGRSDTAPASWTIGGTSCGTLCGISAENMDLDSWTDTQGLHVTNGYTDVRAKEPNR